MTDLTKPMRIAVVAVIPTPYRDPFWAALAALPGIELDVFYCAGSKADRPWVANWEMAYPHQVLPGWNLLKFWRADASFYLNPSMVRMLKRKPYQAILVAGYNHPSMWAALSYARRASIPCYMMCETWRQKRGNGLKALLQRKLVNWSFQRVAGGLPTGQLAARYLVDCGLKRANLFHLPNVPDIAHIKNRMEEAERMRAALREKWGVKNEHLTLFVGRWIPKKRVVHLIESFAKLPDRRDRRLVLVGDGPERENVHAAIERFDMKDEVMLPGFLQPEEVLDWYGAVDLFVQPSAETWGVAVIEAAAAGLPVVISDQAGCHPDLAATWPATQVYAGDDLNALTDGLATPPVRPEHSDHLSAWYHAALAVGLVEFLTMQRCFV
ncbi:MAG: glycosyltransferase involved in cell wall biosynthesis [Kiritimatiellia bacterium]|jgi:glycosyltransferase involved in cell wall biosynthesis